MHKSVSDRLQNLTSEYYSYTRSGEDKYTPFVPEHEEVLNLFPEDMVAGVRKVTEYAYEIDGWSFKFLRDRQGNTYAKTDEEIQPLHTFLDKVRGRRNSRYNGEPRRLYHTSGRLYH